ncbi:DNA/RNA non-specific endonuclease [Hymenobacter sp. H14-R3]|uniref:DNA/RNA non-specific endonuclease n=1 Tax=Hymenobacter sp. H14-R3 TaxID=3046308 RepID=UPI0024BA1F14|nr:DNA/RNA non-specific endonuclease [Hymenobacter sp. H14-R3]MDJ0367508.1 DNA/RNA non-specific endonuclease [Hymenobacter sp. H14-R3]
MAQGDHFIAQLAELKCNQTQLPVPSVFNCVNPAHRIDGRFVGTELDFIPVFNVPPFLSPCKILTAAAAGTPVPCVPFPTPWQGTHAGFMSLGRRLLLTSSYSFCTFGGKIELGSAGQGTASLGGGAGFAASPALGPPTGKVLVCPPGDSTTGWNAELNKVPLEADAKYLVGQTLYQTDGQGRVVKLRGVLTLHKHERNEAEQTAAPRRKDGLENPAYQPDERSELAKPKRLPGQPNPAFVADPRSQLARTKKLAGQPNLAFVADSRSQLARTKELPGPLNPAFVPDTRSWLEMREFLDDGGHLRGAQFDGAGEQINYVSQHMDQNQRRRQAENWFAMENNWAKELGSTPPSDVYVEQTVRYPNATGSSPAGESLRPHSLEVDYWINGEEENESFPQ